MLTKKQAKFLKSLQIKKYRKESGNFVVEGAKNVLEAVNSPFVVEQVYGTPSFLEEHAEILADIPCEEASEKELVSAGSFASNNAGIALVKMPRNVPLKVQGDEFVLVLDDVRDPGNLGTIIRVADWYGIKKIVCSQDTVDVFNPKVISATMGSFTRVSLYYCDLEAYLGRANAPVLGAFLEGENVHQMEFPKAGYLVMGNESKGVSEELEAKVTQKISIPRFGGAESLNVAIATAVLCDNLKR